MHSPQPRTARFIAWLAASLLTAAMVANALRHGARRRVGERPAAAAAAAAHEAGHGREAPAGISWRNLKGIAIRTYREAMEDRLLALAAGVVFYSLLALFPAIAAAVSVYALVADASAVASHLALLDGIVPAAALDIVRAEVTRIAGRGEGQLSFGFLVGLGIALWSANAGMKAIFDALNIIYDQEEKRGFIRLNLVSLAFTLCAIVALLIAASAVVALPLALSTLGLETPLVAYLRWPALLALAIVGLSVLDRYGPSRPGATWRWFSIGSVLAALIWLAGSSLLSWYLGNFANYNATYGALAAVVGLMMWMWLATVAVLFGAELNSELERPIAVHRRVPFEQNIH
ncbi:MAG: YihY/virulence factor BrkB family protein [Hyphomicrobiales bacterium]|nr:YihY/virulence factor BrkB family protein [Hyphomicrobiales bacterium]